MEFTQEQADQITAEEALGTTVADYWENLFEQMEQMDRRDFYTREASRGARRVKHLLDY